MSTPLAIGWAVVGAALAWLVGRLSLRLEGLLPAGEDFGPRGASWTERWLLPALGLIGFFFFAKSEGVTTGLLVHSLWILVLLQILGFDLKHRLILDLITIPSLLVALGLAQFSPHLSVVSALFGVLVGGGALLPMAVVSSLFHGGHAFGWGDVKLGMLIGAITGMSLNLSSLYTLWALIAGALVGGVVTLVLLATRRLGLRDTLPYGPFLIAGCGLILFFM